MDSNNKVSLYRYRTIARFVLPSMLSASLTIVYSLADTFFVSLLGTPQVGAISVAFPVYNIFGIIAVLCGSGSASYISRYLGAGRPQRARRYRNTGLMWFILMAVPGILAGYLFAPLLLPIFGGTDLILPFARRYLFIMIPASVIGGFNIYFGSAVRGEGYPGFAFTALLAGTGINIAADPVLIFFLGMGVGGAAWASCIGQIVSLCMYLVFMVRMSSRRTSLKSGRKKKPFRFVLRSGLGIAKRILPLGLPVGGGQVFMGIVFALAQFYAKRYGTTGDVAAAGIVLRMYAAAMFAVLGFTRGAQPLAGMLSGGGNREGLKVLIRRGAVLLLALSGIISILCLGIPKYIMAVFTQNPAVLNRGGRFLLFSFAGFLPFSFQLYGAGIFQALGDAKKTLYMLLIRNCALFLPVICLLPLVVGLPGIFLSFAIADGLSVFAVLAMRKKLFILEAVP